MSENTTMVHLRIPTVLVEKIKVFARLDRRTFASQAIRMLERHPALRDLVPDILPKPIQPVPTEPVAASFDMAAVELSITPDMVLEPYPYPPEGVPCPREIDAAWYMVSVSDKKAIEAQSELDIALEKKRHKTEISVLEYKKAEAFRVYDSYNARLHALLKPWRAQVHMQKEQDQIEANHLFLAQIREKNLRKEKEREGLTPLQRMEYEKANWDEDEWDVYHWPEEFQPKSEVKIPQ